MSAARPKISVKKELCIELLAQGLLTHEKIGEEVGVSTRTIYEWKRDKDFIDKVVDRSRDLAKARLPKVYDSLLLNAEKGSAYHIKILLDHIAAIEQTDNNVKSNEVTVSWKLS